MATSNELYQRSESKPSTLKWPIRREDYELLDVIGKGLLYSSTFLVTVAF